MLRDAPTLSRRGSRNSPDEMGSAMKGIASILAELKSRSIDTPADKALDNVVRREGNEIILPGEPVPMSLGNAIDTLEKIRADEETTIAFHEQIRGYHFVDGLVAFNDAMADVFGWTQSVPTPGFWGSSPPASMDVQVTLNDRRRVLNGRFVIPNMDGHIDTGVCWDEGVPALHLTGQTLKKFQPLITKLAERTRELVRERSIYRGKAFELAFDDEGKVSQEAPKFVDVGGYEEPIFSRHTEAAIKANIFTPITHSQRCRDEQIPLKRGVLLEGPYGTGKTLVSRKAAQLATQHGWTFVVVRNADDLASGVAFARRFQPSVLFVEDVDRSMEGEDRDHAMDRILNTLDGVDSKNSEVMVVFTSNHAEAINQAMIRPGRLDAVIRIEAPDAEAALRLMKTYARDTLQEDGDYTSVGTFLAGKPAAVIREVVERAKLYAISEIGVDEPFHLPPKSLEEAAATMSRQLQLLDAPKDEPENVGDRLIEAIAERVHAKFDAADSTETRKNLKQSRVIAKTVGAALV